MKRTYLLLSFIQSFSQFIDGVFCVDVRVIYRRFECFNRHAWLG